MTYRVKLRYNDKTIDPRQIRALTFDKDSIDISGSNINIGNIPTVDVTDRASRLLGITYGFQNAPTTPINDFNTDTISSGSSSTHTYTATGNFKLSKIEASASGAIKIEVKSGASGSETTKMVAFTTESNLTIQLEFHEEIQITIGQRIQVIRTNREAQAMDIFSTILGFNS